MRPNASLIGMSVGKDNDRHISNPRVHCLAQAEMYFHADPFEMLILKVSFEECRGGCESWPLLLINVTSLHRRLWVSQSIRFHNRKGDIALTKDNKDLCSMPDVATLRLWQNVVVIQARIYRLDFKVPLNEHGAREQGMGLTSVSTASVMYECSLGV